MRNDNSIQSTDVCGRTSSGQPVVSNGSRTNEAEAEDAGIRFATAGTGISDADGSYWNDSDDGEVAPSDNLRASKQKRLYKLQNDGAHPSAPFYEYNTVRSTESRNARRRKDIVQLTLNFFEDVVPAHVSRERARDVARRIDGCGTEASGGLSLVAVAALVAVWNPSDEELLEANEFRARFREEFADAKKSQGRIFSEMVSLARDVEM